MEQKLTTLDEEFNVSYKKDTLLKPNSESHREGW